MPNRREDIEDDEFDGRNAWRMLDHGLKIVGTFMLTACIAISGWTVSQVNDHGNRLTRQEARSEEVYRVLERVSDDVGDIKKSISEFGTRSIRLDK